MFSFNRETGIRGVLAMVGGLILSGQLQIPEGWEWVGALVIAAGVLIQAGDKNMTAEEMAEELKRLDKKRD
jgi:hypothetical protein